MFCAISGNVPEQPVVSAKGHLYERRLIEKYVAETGKCPITGESLSAEDLKPIVAGRAVKPRTAPAASIPGLLGLFHDEWDALMLETHALRQSLHASRQELSLALYQQDAAARRVGGGGAGRPQHAAVFPFFLSCIAAAAALGSSAAAAHTLPPPHALKPRKPASATHTPTGSSPA